MVTLALYGHFCHIKNNRILNWFNFLFRLFQNQSKNCEFFQFIFEAIQSTNIDDTKDKTMTASSYDMDKKADDCMP